MNRKFSFFRTGLFVISVLCVLSMTFTNVQRGLSPVFAQEADAWVSSQALHVAFVAPQDWSAYVDIELDVPGYGTSTGVVLLSPEETEEITLLSLSREADLTLESWPTSYPDHFPAEAQSTGLDSQIFGYPSFFVFGQTPDGASVSYVLIDRGDNLLEVSYRSRVTSPSMDAFRNVLSTLNPSDAAQPRENLVLDLTGMLVQPDVTPDANVNPEPAEPDLTGAATEKILSVSYVDQVYIEGKKLGKFDGSWNWCGPSSAAVLLFYLGIEKRNVSSDAEATYVIAQNVLESQASNAPMLWGKLNSYLKTRGLFNTYHSTAQAFPSYSEIKSNIDAGKPIMIGIKVYKWNAWNGHIAIIVGYRDPGTVIIQDSFGSRMWETTNWTDKNYATANTYGNKVPYTWEELKARYKSGWLTFTFPRIESLSHTSKPAGSASFTLTVNGAGFVPASKIKWNGTTLTTTYVSDRQLKATISSDKLKSGAVAKVTVYNYDGLNGTTGSANFTINNPVPATSGLSHRVISQTGPDLTITVTGSGFVPTSKVKLNGQTLATTYVSSTQLKAVIPSASRTGVGRATITVYNSTPAGGTSNGQILVKVNFGSYVSILSRHSNKAIDLDNGSTADGARIQQYTWSSGNSNQWWFMIPTGGSNEYWIISWQSTKCLDVSSTTDGTSLTQRTCSFGSKQRFIKIAQGSYYALKNTWSGDLLDVRDWSTGNWAIIQLWSPTYGNNQLWYTK